MVWTSLALLQSQFSATLVDIADETKRQIIVDQEKGQYLGHVSTVLLEDGKTILCVYPKGHGKGAICFKRSVDGGLTWSARLPVPENWASSLETPTIHRVYEPATGKRKLLLWSGLYPARIAESYDDGSTWTPLTPVGNWGGIVVMGFVHQNPDGRLFAMFHDDGRFFHPRGKVSKTFNLYQTWSKDGGKTWAEPHTVWAGSDINLCEPGIVTSPNGDRLAVLLRENRRVKNSHIIFSSDAGETWSQPKEVPAELTGDRHTAKYGPDGRIVVAFRDMVKVSPTKGDFVAWVGTWQDLIEGRPGQYRIRLLDNKESWDSSYPGVECLPDGTFVCTTYGHWEKGQEAFIKSVRFKLSEIDAKVKRNR